MRVITTYFNPCRYRSRLKNYWCFRDSIEKAGARLLTIEMSDGESNFEIEDSVKFQGDCFLWQKENLIKKGMEIIDDDVFAWIDCDVIFEDSDWVGKTMDSLESNDIVQMFRNVSMLNPDRSKDRKFKSMLSEFRDNHSFAEGYPNQGHPGFAFAGWKNKVNFYSDFMFGGDVIFCSSLTHDYWIIHSWDIKDEIKNDIIRWCESVRGVKFSFVDLDIKHLWHGSWANRQYNSRIELINKYCKKVRVKNGLYHCDDEDAKKEFNNFFRQRKEDSIMFL